MNYEESIRQIQSGDTIYELNTPFMDGMRDARGRIYERKFTKYPGQNDEQADYDAGHGVQLELLKDSITITPVMAASKDLLEACKYALQLIKSLDYPSTQKTIEDAINKAEEGA